MNAILRPILLGVFVYAVSAIGLLLLMSIAVSFEATASWFLLAITVIPLSLSSYVAAKYTSSTHYGLRMTFGILSAITGFTVTLLMISAEGQGGGLVVAFIVAALIAAIGAFVGARNPVML